MTNPGQTKLFGFELGKLRSVRYPLSARKERGQINLGNKITPEPTLAGS